MIWLEVDDKIKTVLLRQDVFSPVVYLDHAPWMEIAERQPGKLVSAIRGRNGTLAVSWLNAVELADPEYERTFSAAEQLFVEAFPNVAFLEVTPDEVISREDRDKGGPVISRPQLDRRFLEDYGRIAANGPPSIDPINPAGFLKLFRLNRDAIRAQWKGAADRMVRSLEWARRVGYPKAVLSNATKTSRPTRHVHDLALEYLVRGGPALTSQNVRDLHHLVVPLSYCDYVVLDKQWADRAAKIQGQLRAAGLLSHEARVYRVGELGRFLADIERDSYVLPLSSGSGQESRSEPSK